MKMLMVDSNQQDKISQMIEVVKTASFNERRTIDNDEETLNAFLDSINSLKRELSLKTDIINSIIPKLEELTWFNNPNEETLKQVNELIALIKDLYTIYNKKFINYSNTLKKGEIATAEIEAFECCLHDLAEIGDDLENVFFTFPQDKEFQTLNQQLSAL